MGPITDGPERSKEAPATTGASSSSASSADGSVFAAYKLMKAARDSLPKRPSKEEVEAASGAVLATLERLEKDTVELATQNVAVADEEQARALKRFREHVLRTKAQMELLSHVAVLELDKSYRHYDAAVQVAEKALLSGKSSASWIAAVDELERAVPDAILSLNLPRVFGTQHAPSDTGLQVSYVPADVHPANSFSVLRGSATPATTGTGTGTVPGSLLSAEAPLDVPTLPPRPSNGKATAKPIHGKAFSPPNHVPYQGPYSPGSGFAGRALSAADRARAMLRVSGAPVSDVFRVSGPTQELIPLSATVGEGNPVVINSLLLKIIQDSVQSRPRTLDIRGHLFDAPLLIIPETLGFVDSLVDLNVAENRLVVLPESLGGLKKLQTLDASCNELLELPKSIGELKELQELDLHHNKIEELPVAIGGCTALEVLHLDFNQLRGLPTALGQLKKLRVFTMGLNMVSILPYTLGQMENLRELDVRHNQVQGLPESLGQLKHLEKLNVSGNNYDLQALPKSIGLLGSLQELDLRENHIKILPGCMTLLTNLKTLKLEGNPWQSPPMEVTRMGLEAIMEYLKDKDIKAQLSEDTDRQGSGRGGSAFFRLFKMGGKKGDANPYAKLDDFLAHSTTT